MERRNSYILGRKCEGKSNMGDICIGTYGRIILKLTLKKNWNV
jgi:hypothetical protein